MYGIYSPLHIRMNSACQGSYQKMTGQSINMIIAISIRKWNSASLFNTFKTHWSRYSQICLSFRRHTLSIRKKIILFLFLQNMIRRLTNLITNHALGSAAVQKIFHIAHSLCELRFVFLFWFFFFSKRKNGRPG